MSTTRRKLWLSRSVVPFKMDFSSDPEKTVLAAFERLRERNRVLPGDPIVVVSDVAAGQETVTAPAGARVQLAFDLIRSCGAGVDEYDIYLRGFAADKEPPELGLQRLFGIDAQRARVLVLSLPRVVKQRISAEQAVRYELALRHLGADYELRKSPLRPAQTNVVGVRRDPDSVHDVRAGDVLSLPPPTTALSAAAVAKSTGTHARHAPVAQPLPPIRGTVRSAMNDGDLPPPWEVPGLQTQGRADWVEHGPAAYESTSTPAEPAPAGASPSLPSSRRSGAMRASALPGMCTARVACTAARRTRAVHAG